MRVLSTDDLLPDRGEAGQPGGQQVTVLTNEKRVLGAVTNKKQALKSHDMYGPIRRVY